MSYMEPGHCIHSWSMLTVDLHQAGTSCQPQIAICMPFTSPPPDLIVSEQDPLTAHKLRSHNRLVLPVSLCTFPWYLLYLYAKVHITSPDRYWLSSEKPCGRHHLELLFVDHKLTQDLICELSEHPRSDPSSNKVFYAGWLPSILGLA